MPLLELTPEQERLVAGASEPIRILIQNSPQRYVIVSEEAYQKMKELAQVDEVEDSLYEFEDIPDDA